MKLLYIASDVPTTRSMRAGFTDAGAHVIYADDRSNLLVPRFLANNIYIWRFIRKSRTLKRMHNRRFNAQLRAIISRERPDAVLVCKGMMVSRETLDFARSQGALTANWFLDNVDHPLYFRWFRDRWQDYDVMMSFDSSVARRFHSDGTRTAYVPAAIDPAHYEALEPSDEDHRRFDCDVCFIGAAYPERVRALQELRRAGGVRLRIFGWKGWEATPLADLYGGPLDLRESALVARCAKINLNMNIEPAVCGVNMKTFEIPAAGGFQLTDFRADLPELFRVGIEVATFNAPDGLQSAVRRWLSDAAGRAAIAEAGRERALASHTFAARARDILALLQR